MNLEKIKEASVVYLSYVLKYQYEKLNKRSKDSIDRILESGVEPVEFGDIELFSDYKKDPKKRVEGAFIRIKEKLYVVFMASNSWQDWISNLFFFKKKIPYNNVKNRKIRAHSGYIKRYTLNSVRTRILLWTADYSEIEDITVIGYSMGGGLAPICSVDLAYNFPDKKVHCIAMAGPRIGNRAFAKSIESRVDTIHISYGADPVVKVPPRLFGFRHLDTRLHLGKEYPFWRIKIEDHYPDKIYEKLFSQDLILL